MGKGTLDGGIVRKRIAVNETGFPAVFNDLHSAIGGTDENIVQTIGILYQHRPKYRLLQ